MSDARDVIARALDATDLGQEGNRVPDYHPDDQALMRDYTRWDDFTDRAEKLRSQRHRRAADAVVDALTARGKAIVDVYDGPDEFVAALDAISFSTATRDNLVQEIAELAEHWDDMSTAGDSKVAWFARKLRALIQQETANNDAR